jgi:hypothetical protein
MDWKGGSNCGWFGCWTSLSFGAYLLLDVFILFLAGGFSTGSLAVVTTYGWAAALYLFLVLLLPAAFSNASFSAHNY